MENNEDALCKVPLSLFYICIAGEAPRGSPWGKMNRQTKDDGPNLFDFGEIRY